ncbi:hypothetical protein [Sphingomonas sp. S2-65]|uniref:hypothetical protein n=1 Tax=Sphingomonas sp. S2-65 TaxID=2903960 RepID=UPI001F45C8D8|nr:hypothetical protein [Sphingomonas sp. S2-65]UYY56940.1 hypothetical protein LZ586_09545 [Sphingomonas sp. S2-65]
MVAPSALAQSAGPSQDQGRSSGQGSVSTSAVGEVGKRLTRSQTGAAPMARISNRIQNRIQSRLRNRIDRNYDSQKDAASPFAEAENRAQNTSQPQAPES